LNEAEIPKIPSPAPRKGIRDENPFDPVVKKNNKKKI